MSGGSPACVAAVAAVGIAVPLITHGVTGGSAGGGPAGGGPAAPATSPAVVMPTATPIPVPTAAPGTVLRDCQNNNNGTLSPDWKAQSIHAGPVWFIFARGSKSFPRGQRLARGLVTAGAFVIAVSNGRTAIVTDAPAAAGRFRFLAGFTGSNAYRKRVGAPGLTLVGCPPGPAGTDIPESYAPGLTMFWQGYVNNLGQLHPAGGTDAIGAPAHPGHPGRRHQRDMRLVTAGPPAAVAGADRGRAVRG